MPRKAAEEFWQQSLAGRGCSEQRQRGGMWDGCCSSRGNLWEAKGTERKGPLGSFLQTYFISSGSSLSSFVGVILIPLFLARGQPDRLWLKREERAVSLAESLHLLFPRFSHLSLEFRTVFLISLVLQLHITRRSQEEKKNNKKLREMDSN